MGILDMVEGLAGQGGQGGGAVQNAKVAGGLTEALQEQPGGVAGLVERLKQNGMGEHAQAWTNGQTTPLSQEQVQQGLGGSGLMEKVAEKTGLSPTVIQMAMTTVLPMVVAHFSRGGQPVAQNEMGGMAQQLMSRFL